MLELKWKIPALHAGHWKNKEARLELVKLSLLILRNLERLFVAVQEKSDQNFWLSSLMYGNQASASSVLGFAAGFWWKPLSADFPSHQTEHNQVPYFGCFWYAAIIIAQSVYDFVETWVHIRVSHLQFFLISLLFQAGIYARHTKEQETYRFLMF